MRTHYRISGNNERVASSSVKKALNYQLPTANYMVPEYKQEDRKSAVDADQTRIPPIRPITKLIDSRIQKL